MDPDPSTGTVDSPDNKQARVSTKSSSSSHKRTYQACLPCRRRKVRCDLGSVDEPGDPPCQRCRREKKECVFSETRRKRKADDENGLSEDYIQRNKRVGPTSALDYDGSIHSTTDTGAKGPYAGTEESSEYNDPLVIENEKKKGGNMLVENKAAAALFSRPITKPSEAMDMLVYVAHHTQEADNQLREESEANAAARARQETNQPMIDPAIVAMQTRPTFAIDPMMSKAISTWASVRFVQAGWFTPQEGIAYVSFFYEHLAPFTPVSPPDFSNPLSHGSLFSDEPMLTVTILTIASRYMPLKGPGASARSFWVHDKMWNYLQGMITKMFWGQEQFGGGFCGAGRFRNVEETEAQRRGLRSLGTVESLLLLSDWLPRAMHFPPGDDGGDLIVTGSSNPFDSPEMFAPAPKIAHSDWTEPAIRSDRMCWSLVGTAYTLAFELGVFDSLIGEGKWTMGKQLKTVYDPERADRIGRLLFVYVSQTCGRLGFPNMMPHQGTEHDFDFLKMDVPPGTYVGPYHSVTSADRIQRAWAELTALMRQSNTELFESKQKTNESIKKGTYWNFLQKYNPKLKMWKERFEQTDVPEKARIMLMMEYEYSRTYINSLSLQAVLDNTIETESAEAQMGQSNGHTPPAFVSSKAVDLKEKNKPYISELTDAARNLLTLAVEDLHRVGGLKNAPVRTHFRILSGAMFLLKTFALGGTKSEVTKSWKLLRQTITTLRESVPDDVHLSLRISELLSSLTEALGSKFIAVSKPSGSKNTNSHGTSSTTKNRPTSGGVNPSLHPRTSSYSNLGIQPREVDLNDLNTTIMPPPNFAFHNSTFGDSYAIADSPSTPTAGYSPLPGNNSNSVQSPPAVRQRHNSNSATAPMFSPNNAFSPMSTGSGAAQQYDWWAIDMHPLVQTMQNNAAGNTQSTPTSQSGQLGPTTTTTGNGMAASMNSRGASPNVSAPGFDTGGLNNLGAWTNGAFGPEISEGLEWLGTLGTGAFGDWQGEGNNYP